MNKKIIVIASQFSVYPGGRVDDDGPHNGTKFRTQFIIPALECAIQNDDSVTIDFDGTRGYGSSFLDEAFGGLIRLGYNKDQILKYIKFKSSRQSVVAEVMQYINKAAQGVKR